MDAKAGHLPSTCTLVCITPSDVPSAVLVGIGNGTKVMNEPDNRRERLADLPGARMPLRRLGRGQQVPAVPDYQTRTTVSLEYP